MAAAQETAVQPGPLLELREEDDEGDFYAVEALIKERKGRNGELAVLVKWTGYAEPQWIKASDVLPGDLQRLRVEKGLRERKKRGRLAPC